MTLFQRILSCLLLTALPLGADAQLPHGEVAIGRSASGQLVGHFESDGPVVVPRSVFAGITGFATGLIGFESIVVDEEAEGLFTLAAESQITAELIALVPPTEVRVYDGLSTLPIGGAMQLGSPIFDYHPTFNIPSPTAAPGQIFEVHLVLHDLSGNHATSDAFIVSITPACDGDFNLSGDVGVQDLFDFLTAYFGNSLEADVNRSGTLSVQDAFDFLAAFFTPCG